MMGFVWLFAFHSDNAFVNCVFRADLFRSFKFILILSLYYDSTLRCI